MAHSPIYLSIYLAHVAEASTEAALEFAGRSTQEGWHSKSPGGSRAVETTHAPWTGTHARETMRGGRRCAQRFLFSVCRWLGGRHAATTQEFLLFGALGVQSVIRIFSFFSGKPAATWSYAAFPLHVWPHDAAARWRFLQGVRTQRRRKEAAMGSPDTAK